MSSADELAKAVAEIEAASKDAATPPEMAARLEAFWSRQGGAIQGLSKSILIDYIALVEELMDDAGETDREVIDRHVAYALVRSAAVIIENMYRNMGVPSSPGRFALVAFQIAESLKALVNAEEAKSAAG